MSQKTINKSKNLQSPTDKKIAFINHSTSDGMTRLYGVIFRPSTTAPAIKKKPGLTHKQSQHEA